MMQTNRNNPSSSVTFYGLLTIVLLTTYGSAFGQRSFDLDQTFYRGAIDAVFSENDCIGTELCLRLRFFPSFSPESQLFFGDSRGAWKMASAEVKGKSIRERLTEDETFDYGSVSKLVSDVSVLRREKRVNQLFTERIIKDFLTHLTMFSRSKPAAIRRDSLQEMDDGTTFEVCVQGRMEVCYRTQASSKGVGVNGRPEPIAVWMLKIKASFRD